MAVDGDSGKQARLFPCLAILRYTVATVVTVLAVVVIVMVIAVGVRPDNVSVSIVQGHVGTTDLWKYETTSTASVGVGDTAANKAIRPRGSCIGVTGGPYSAALSGPCFGFGPGGGDSSFSVGPYAVYTPVHNLSLEVALSVDNQSGRGTIYCRSINVTFRTGASGGGTAPAGMVIGVLNLPPSFDFHAKPQTSHRISREVTFDDPTVLKYIADTYGGESSFTGTVEVAINTSSVVTALGHHTTPRIVHLVCSPVDFSVRDATATATSVQCIMSN